MSVKVSNKKGVTVQAVARNSPFYVGGLRKNDRIISINGECIDSELEFHFFTAQEFLEISVIRGQMPITLNVKRREGNFSGVTLIEQPIHRCANSCIFCFIDQMPRGLRKSLYVKDEDIRLSLFNGNYVTLSTFGQHDLERIVRIGLSPLYISVHTTDPVLRGRMLGNRRSRPVMEQLVYLARHGIRFHTQIVVCPGYNDGEGLERSLKDLLSLNDALCSIAVVPVGLTRFSNETLLPVDALQAAALCRTVARLSDRALQRDGYRKLFLADELFIKAKLPIPATGYYEDYPQIENGVGLVRQLLDSWNEIKSRRRTGRSNRNAGSGRRRVVITSVSALPFLKTIIEELAQQRPEIEFEIVPVVNMFFGETVTVAGLLTARDILRAVKDVIRRTPAGEVIVPAVVLNHAGYTLDGYSPERLTKAAGIPVRFVNTIDGVAA